jgi:hypothetical protein
MASKWKKQLRAYDDAVDFEYDAFAPENCLYSPSPYFNWIFANGSHGIPKGSTLLFGSKPKSGKSLLIQALIGESHQRDPECEAIIFNTEQRGFLQNGVFPSVDEDRLTIYDTNKPEEIGDRFENDILPLIQDGMKISYVAIDSLNRVGGTKTMAEGRSVNDQLMGDKALTLARVLEKIVPICRRHKITLIGTCQVRANFDAGQYGPKEKLGINWDSRHTFDYFIQADRAGSKEDKEDILGNKLESDVIKDARGNKDITGHKIYIKMLESSVGTPGRSGVITFDYKRGIVNTFEELFELGKSTGFIKAAPGKKAGTYLVGDKEVFGKANAAEHMLDPNLAKTVIEHAKSLDTK